ncbi:hypothetical protein BZG36_04786 [Bifiguratus adelaidae]|uniref:2,4-dienoyl-CoA reductase [(3E)-enoyl-CoA-producing] n=1 Tax=Bifiguratus adelaidae TaxID=1938954 RepID=A0A261XTZ8_9FUNG|nr:hypothetical protein BZG36_04786 [Bifiguratus adelaidae]
MTLTPYTAPAPVPTSRIFHKDIFHGKIVLCSGGGSGICRGMTEALLRHGAKACIISRNKERIEKAAKEMSESTGQEVLGLSADVREPAQVEAAVKATVERFGKIDILINGAAGNFLSPISDLSYNAFKTVIDIDLRGTFNLTKAALDELKKSHGTILNVTATLAYTGTPFQAHAGSAKAAIDAMTKHQAVELGPFGIRANVIAPGPIASTVGMAKLSHKPKDGEAPQPMAIPLGRIGEIRDIEHTTLFLCSEAACWITGVIIVVDGGCWMTLAPYQYPQLVLNPPSRM